MPDTPDSLALLTDLDRVWDTLGGAVATAALAHSAGMAGAEELATDAVALGDAVAARYGSTEVGGIGGLLREAGRLGKRAVPKLRAVAKGSKLLTTIILAGAGAYVLTQGERVDLARIEAQTKAHVANLDKLPEDQRKDYALKALGELGANGSGPPWGWIFLGALGLGFAAWAARKWGGNRA